MAMPRPWSRAAVILALALTPAFAVTAPPAMAVPRAQNAPTYSGIDFNGDGFDDAAVGDPYATVNGLAQAGQVVILYGDADGRIGEGARRVITQSDFPDSIAEAGDRFGFSLAIDEVTDDGRADLLVGSPGEDVLGKKDVGCAHLISLTRDDQGGPGPARALVISQLDTFTGQIEEGDQFGYSVALADYGGSDYNHGIVGAPGEDIGTAADAGVADIFSFIGDPIQGALLVEGEEIRQGGPLYGSEVDIPGIPEPGDRFGATVLEALVKVQPSGYPAWRNIVGAPGDQVNGKEGAGSVTTFELEGGPVQQVTQDSPGVPGVAEVGDAFGFSLAVSNPDPTISSTSRQHLAVGSPGENFGGKSNAGSVLVFDTGPTGLTARTSFTQDLPGLASVAESDDQFGRSLAFQPNGLLAVGVPYEDVGSTYDAGLVQTVQVSEDQSAVRPGPSYTESSPGTPNTVAVRNRFGLSLSSLNGANETLLAMTSPYAGSGSVFLLVTPQLGETPAYRSWVPGSGGIPVAAGSGRFGWSFSGTESG